MRRSSIPRSEITNLRWQVGQRLGLRFVYAHSSLQPGYTDNQFGVIGFLQPDRCRDAARSRRRHLASQPSLAVQHAVAAAALNWTMSIGEAMTLSDLACCGQPRAATLTLRRWSVSEWLASEAAWQRLLARSNADILFLSWEWLTLWWQCFGDALSAAPEILAFYRGEDLRRGCTTVSAARRAQRLSARELRCN